MSLERIAENTGNTLIMSFVTNLVNNAFKNRSLKAKIDMSYKNSLQQTRMNFVNSVICDRIEKSTGKAPNTFTGSFVTNLLTETKLFCYTSLKNSIYSGAIAYAIEKAQRFI